MTRRSLLFAAQLSMEEAQRRQGQYVLDEFTKRWNALIDAEMNFAEKFNAGKGYVWPRKEAKVLIKALDKLRDSEAFLKEK